MKRFEKCKRVLATLLVALMVLQQTSIITLAEELQVETQTAQEEKAVEQEAKPETSAPETIKQTEAPTEAPKPTEAPTEAPAPETQATEAPVTEAPATEPQVTEAPVTEPQVTEATETEPQVTETPATEPQITEAPETETTEAVTEKKTEEEKESESTTEETEAATKDSFHSIAENVDAKVTLSKGISEDAIFVAKQYDLDSDYVAQNVDDALGAWIEAHNLTVLDAAVYDMYFEEDGKEIAVKQNAKVNLTFNSPILTETGDADVATDVYVLHVVNGKAKEVGTVTRNGNDAVTAATINTDGFSPFVFVKAVSGDAAAQMDGTSTSNVEDVIYGVEISGPTDGTTYDPNNSNKRTDHFKVTINFKEIPRGNQFGSTMYYQIPNVFNIDPVTTPQRIMSNDNGVSTEIGTYTIDSNGKVTINFNEKVHNNDAYNAYFKFEAWFKTEEVSKTNEKEVNFGGEIKKTFKFEPAENLTVKKTSIVDKNDPTLFHYTITVTAGETGATNVVLKDYMSNVKLQGKFKKNSVDMDDGEKGVEKDQWNEYYTIHVGDMKPNETVTITCDAKIPSEKLSNLNGKIDTENTVEGKSDYSESKRYTVKNTYKYELIKKDNAVLSADGKTAKWTVTVNGGGDGSKIDLNGYTVKDALSDADKLAGYELDTSQPFEVLVDGVKDTSWSWDNVTHDGSNWSYTFGENSNHTYTFIYYTKVPENHSLDNITVKNKATLTKDGTDKGNDEGQGTIPSTGLPENIIEKDNGILETDPDDATLRYIKWVMRINVPANTEYPKVYLDDDPWNNPSYQIVDISGGVVNSDSPAHNQVGITSSNSDVNKIVGNWKATIGGNNNNHIIVKGADGNKITLPAKDEPYTITMVYYTRLTNEGLNQDHITNRVTLHVKNLSKYDDGIYKPGKSDSYVSEKKGDYDSKNHTITWTILLNKGAKAWDEGIFSIEDTLDSNLEFDRSSVQVQVGKNQHEISSDTSVVKDTDYELTVNDNTFRIQFKNLKELTEGAKIYGSPCPCRFVKITYVTKVKDSVYTTEESTWVNNEFVLKKDDKKIERVDSKVEVKPSKPFKKKLTKEASGLNGFKASYSMTVNPEKVFLSNDSTKENPQDYVIVDTLLPCMHLDIDSLVIKKNGEVLAKDAYDAPYEDNVLTIRIPNGDGAKYEISYDVYVKGKIGEEVTYKNKAILRCKGKEYTQTTSEKKVKMQTTSAGGSSKDYSLELGKWNENNTKRLSATFELSEYYNGHWGEPREITTLTEGNVSLGTVHAQGSADILYADVLYRLVETKEPSGYIKSTEPYYFVIGEEATSEIEIPAEVKTYETYFASQLENGDWKILDSIQLTNKEAPGSLEIKKDISGLTTEDEQKYQNKTYQFTVQDADGNYYALDGKVSKDKQILTITAGNTITVTNLPNGQYTVKEIADESTQIPGYVLAESGATGVGVKVEKGTEAKLTVTNRYTNVKAVIKVHKIVSTGEGVSYTGSEKFQFTLTGVNGAPMPSGNGNVVEVENGKTGSFGGITYTAPGTYTYKVKETKGSTPGMSYDEEEHEVTVTVSEDLKTATVDYGTEKAESLTVTNNYTDAKAAIKVSKIVSTGEGVSYTGSETFKFTLAGVNGAPMPSGNGNVVEVENGKTGSFGGITYTAPGTYTYKVKETKGSTPGMSYDEEEHEVTVTVSEDLKTATVDYGTEKAESLTVTNNYTDAKATIKVAKVVEGEGFNPNEEFEFVLTSVEGTPMPDDSTVKVKAGSEAAFGAIEYTATGTYEYTVKEKAGTTVGMIYDTSEHKVTVTVEGTDKLTATVKYEDEKADKLTITNKYNGLSAKISKVDIADGKELEGAHIQILDKDGKVVEEWDSTKEAHEVTGLKTGETYTLRETVAPDGYGVTTDTTFVLKADGTIDTEKTKTTSKDGVLLVEDKKTSVKVSKVDIADGKELEGAHIQILDKDGKVVEEWDSTKEAHEVTGLKTGETYTLRETVAPDGYGVTTDTTFVLKADGTIDTEKTKTTSKDGVLLVEDKKTSVKVSKVDIADGKELEGAHIQILDKDGKVVEEWDSKKEAHEVTGLKTGETYTLRETVAPDGYDLTTDTTFVLKEDGTVDTAQTTTTTKDGVLLVEDAKTVETDKAIEVTKRLISIDGPVLNAEDATFYVALYADAECTQRVSAVKALEFKNASSATVTFKNLKADTTYYVGECDQNGTSYGVGTTSDGVTYVADFGSSNKVEITNADGTKEVHFDNQFLTVPDGYNIEAYLSITKKVLDVDGNAVNSNETFYAGLFADKDYTTLSTEVSQNIIPLSMDGGSEKTVTLMVPIIPGGTVNLYVTEVDKDGNPVANSKSFAYDVEVSGGEIVLSDEGKTFSVTITNSEQNVETETETETETEVETETEKGTQKTTEKKTTKAAKTGDDTPIGALAGALAVSAAVIVIYFKRRKKNEE